MAASPHTPEPDQNSPRFQFRLWQLLALMTVWAVILAFVSVFHPLPDWMRIFFALYALVLVGYFLLRGIPLLLGIPKLVRRRRELLLKREEMAKTALEKKRKIVEAREGKEMTADDQ